MLKLVRFMPAFLIVMSSPISPSLHRLEPRRVSETTAYGYELVSQPETVEDCVRSIHWIDSWCPDAAQFVLVDASRDLTARTCSRVLDTIEASHLAHKVQLVCKTFSLADDTLLDAFRERHLGVVLDHDADVDLEAFTAKGILGIRLGTASRCVGTAIEGGFPARSFANAARELGLRSIASQVPSASGVRDLLAVGFDYVSQRGCGFAPVDSGFPWARAPSSTCRADSADR